MRVIFAPALVLLSAACVHSRVTYIAPVADDGGSSKDDGVPEKNAELGLHLKGKSFDSHKASINEDVNEIAEENISVRIPIVAKKLFGLQNRQSTEHPAGTTVEYFIGATTSSTNTKSITDRVENQYNAYAEISAEYGFADIASVSATVGFSYTNTKSKETATINQTGKTLTQNKKLTITLGAIPPGKAKYVYQFVAQAPSAIMDFTDLIISEEEIQLDTGSAVVLEGTSVRNGVNQKFAIVSLHDTNKCLSYFAGYHLYLGSTWVLNSPTYDSCEWWAERCTAVTGIHAYWIVHKSTGKILTWYEGVDVYAGDPWVKQQPFGVGLSALWKIEPSGEIGGAFYFQHFKTAKVLSWYNGYGDKPYAGDPWVKKAGGPEASGYSSLWKIVAQG